MRCVNLQGTLILNGIIKPPHLVVIIDPTPAAVDKILYLPID